MAPLAIREIIGVDEAGGFSTRMTWEEFTHQKHGLCVRLHVEGATIDLEHSGYALINSLSTTSREKHRGGTSDSADSAQGDLLVEMAEALLEAIGLDEDDADDTTRAVYRDAKAFARAVIEFHGS